MPREAIEVPGWRVTAFGVGGGVVAIGETRGVGAKREAATLARDYIALGAARVETTPLGAGADILHLTKTGGLS